MAVEQIAEDKVRALVGQRKALKGQGYLILGADTAVFCGDRFLGKPKNEVEAEEFLRLLSGREHEIITGVFILDLDLDQAFRGHEMSRVQFKSLSEKEIRDYIALGEGFDKAGGYGIQGEARKFVIQQTGSWSNIVGLPMELFTRWVKDNGWVFLGHQNT